MKLKTRSKWIRLITIDHGPDNSIDDQMRCIDIRRRETEQDCSILKDYGIGEIDSKRWARFCDGCPRIAHVVGENLRGNHSFVLAPPATVDVWDRFFIVGREDPESDQVQLRRIVLQFISLFERFGFHHPVDKEAKYIAGLIERFDSRVSWSEFKRVVEQLQKRRILQGSTTLYITPRAFQIYLCREFGECSLNASFF